MPRTVPVPIELRQLLRPGSAAPVLQFRVRQEARADAGWSPWIDVPVVEEGSAADPPPVEHVERQLGMLVFHMQDTFEISGRGTVIVGR